jgi:uncharacterized protein YjeT (DUF2065 family)
VYCPNCGEKLSRSNQNYCIHCGTALKLNIERVQPKKAVYPTKSATAPSPEYTSKSMYSTREVTPYQQVPIKKKGIIGKYSIRCFILAIISFLLALHSIIIGLYLIFLINSSIYLKYDIISLWYYINYFSSGDLWFYPAPELVLEDGLRLVAHISGVVLILFGIAGFILGQVARRIRRKALYNESDNKLVKIGGVLAIFGIILNIAGALIGAYLFYIPFYVSRRNFYLNLIYF